ncbi:hypothetical protein [Rubrolithibacter danxiaensis]|uniref:hypothetical protein n=1 Tax=Rubrolithibacter danxiaensis TaxID=3390805 RepID=UPI003BF838D8
MKKGAVITGDIAGFTSLKDKQRESLIAQLKEIFASWTEKGYAELFRGDSFQLLVPDFETSIKRSLQLRCWFKKVTPSKQKTVLDAKMVIGLGEISYFNNSVLDADGEAFHYSGRTFDKMEETGLRIVTKDEKINKQLDVITDLMNVIIGNWTTGQSEVIYQLLEDKTQQQIADNLHIAQSAVNNRIKLSRWKEIEKTIAYIISLTNDLF